MKIIGSIVLYRCVVTQGPLIVCIPNTIGVCHGRADYSELRIIVQIRIVREPSIHHFQPLEAHSLDVELPD